MTTENKSTKPELEELAPETIQRLMEATYFLQQMTMTYQEPTAFRFNLNATIQAIRNITFVLQAELSDNDIFQNWYPSKQDEMRANPLLRQFVEARNIIVKKKSLEARSKASVGLFVYHRLKLWIQNEVCPNITSEHLLNTAKAHFTDVFVDKNHSAEWEQLGVKREWIATELGEDEVVGLCNRAIDYFGVLLIDLANSTGHNFQWQPGEISKLSYYQILLETDLDPSLPKKWGWE